MIIFQGRLATSPAVRGPASLREVSPCLLTVEDGRPATLWSTAGAKKATLKAISPFLVGRATGGRPLTGGRQVLTCCPLPTAALGGVPVFLGRRPKTASRGRGQKVTLVANTSSAASSAGICLCDGAGPSARAAFASNFLLRRS